MGMMKKMQKKNIRDFTVGDPKKVILAFYMPMLFTSMLQQLYNFVDTLIVGKGLGDDCVAAVGNMGSLFFLIVGFSMGLSNGFGIIIAQNFGAKDYVLLKKNYAATIQLSCVLTLILTALSVTYLPLALRILKTDPVIMKDCLKYGYIVFGGLFATILYNVSSCVLRSLGDSKTPLYAIIISSVVNVLMDCFFIFVLRTGVEGAAIATVVSQLFSAFICLMKLRGIELVEVHREDFVPDYSRYRVLLKNGLPMAFMNSITAIGCMVVQSFVNKYGVAYTSAYSVCSRYINLFMNPACTAGAAMSAFAGQNFGAGRFDRIWQGLKVCLTISFVSYMIFGSVMIFGHHHLAAFVLKGEDTVALADSYLPITGVLLLMVDFLFVFRSAVQGMGYPVFPMFSGGAEMLLRIGTIVLLMDRIGFRATAFAEASAWTGALLINVIAFLLILRSKERSTLPQKTLRRAKTKKMAI